MNRFLSIYALILALLYSGPAFSAGEIIENVHLGVATCATSQCHGKRTQQDDQQVWLNEYRLWVAQDRHSRAYRTLETEESQLIAAKLGLASAASADICLDCHTDNVPVEKRGPKFQITDGVGCEACHGGSQKWLESHAESDATHAENLALGMYPTEAPLSRVDICLDCHLGTDNQFATHEIMGAGHPRLTFELESFTANQPAHYSVDADYVERKGDISGFKLWLSGQLGSAKRYLALIQGQLFDQDRMVPEFAFYDCHSCHHPMDDLRWSKNGAAKHVKPGSLRLQDQHLLILAAVCQAIDPERLSSLRQASAGLIKAGQISVGETRTQAAALTNWIAQAQVDWNNRTFTSSDVSLVRKTLLKLASADQMSDYADAEQVFFAVESLSIFLGDGDSRQAQLDALYQAVEEDSDYSPARFREAATRALSVF